jgi:hypothetical protein
MHTEQSLRVPAGSLPDVLSVMAEQSATEASPDLEDLVIVRMAYLLSGGYSR